MQHCVLEKSAPCDWNGDMYIFWEVTEVDTDYWTVWIIFQIPSNNSHTSVGLSSWITNKSLYPINLGARWKGAEPPKLLVLSSLEIIFRRFLFLDYCDQSYFKQRILAHSPQRSTGIRVASVIELSVCLFSVCLFSVCYKFSNSLQHNIRLPSRNCNPCATEFRQE